MDLAKIKEVTICSSSKFYATAQQVASELEDCGVVVHTPRFDFDEELVQVSTEDKIQLTREFLRKIHRSDAIYVVAENGYTGSSVCIEVGYASALGKVVILSESPTEGAIAALANTVIDTDKFPSELRK